MKRGKRDSAGRLRDSKGRLMKDPAKKSGAKKRKAGAKKSRAKRNPHALALPGAKRAGKRTIAARVHALEQGQNVIVEAVKHLNNRVNRVEHAVVQMAEGLQRRFGSGGGAARQLGAG